MARNSQLEMVRPRVVFKAYGVGMAALSLVLYTWGPAWLHSVGSGQPLALNALARVAGACSLLLAGTALCLTRFGDPTEERRTLWWFTAGHWVLAGTILIQGRLIWGRDLPDWYAAGLNAMLLIASALLAGLAVVEDRGRRTPHAAKWLLPNPRLERHERSKYEEEIRKAAAIEERTRFARDLHDAVKQQLFAIQTSAATAEARLSSDRMAAGQALSEVRQSARSAMAELDAIIEGLRVAPVELSGLHDALRRECEALEHRTGARVTLSFESPQGALFPPGASDVLYRVAQEALSNVARHARAKRVEVSVRATAYTVELAVEDDGTGFDETQAAAGQGLGNMRSRAAEQGGGVEIRPRPSGGTSVSVWIPMDVVDPKYFRARAIGYTLAALAVLAVFLMRAVPVTWEASILTLALFFFNAIRYGLAWRRARRLPALGT